MNTKHTTPLELSSYLDSEASMAEYLNVVMESGSANDIIVALGHVAKAKGMTDIAERSGLSRPSLYKALDAGSKPQFDTILKVVRALGITLATKSL
jgi:probable addiction module antidote protein